MPKGKTKEEFINDANKVHKFFYDYSKVEYKNNKTKVIIICPIHGEFEQRPDSHIGSKQGCKKCYHESLRLKKEEIILKFNVVYNNFYDYSKINYINNRTKVIIICPIHGEFKKRPFSHLNGEGCPKCKGFNMTKNEFLKQANIIHNNKFKYDLSNFKNKNSKITIICPIHGKFIQKISSHINDKQGCKKCYHQSLRFKKEEVILKFNIVHNNFYDYSKINYKNKLSKLEIICPIHGVFYKTYQDHINGYGCPKCRNKSVGEDLIEKYLINNNIKYKYNYRFEKCKNKNTLPFDFYLYDNNICIEFDGQQHFEEVKIFGGKEKLKYTQQNDKIKNDFCKNNKIKLIRIPYFNMKNINIILDNNINI